MPRIREARLINDGSVCENAHAYEDPSVTTAAQANAKGRQRCPLWDPCASGNLQRRDRMLCTASVGQVMARAILEGSSIEAEVEELQASPFLKPGSFRYIDPYSENPTENAETDTEKGKSMIVGWAETILYGPNGQLNPSTTEEQLPDFLSLSRSAMREGGVDLLVINDAVSNSQSNGGISCDVSIGPCSCGAWH